MSRPDSLRNHDTFDVDTLTAQTTLGYPVTDVDLDPHLSVLANCRLPRAVLPVGHVDLLAVELDATVGVYTWPAPLAVSPLGARP